MTPRPRASSGTSCWPARPTLPGAVAPPRAPCGFDQQRLLAFGSARSDADGLRTALVEARVAAEAAAARAAEMETAFSAQVILGVYLPSSQHDAAVRTLRKLSFK